MNDNPKPLIQHLIEFRSVLVNSAFCVLLLTIVCYVFVEEIFGFVSTPLFIALKSSGLKEKIIFTSVTEVFTTHLRLAFYSGLFASFPYIMKQIWDFINSGLKPKESLIAKRIMVISPLLFILGATFAFYLVIPNVLLALIKSSAASAEFLPKMNENISFIVIMLISFGISFQMPIVVFALDRLLILRAKTLLKLWREIVLGIVVLSAIITPPDAFSMVFLAAPLIVVFFISVFICR